MAYFSKRQKAQMRARRKRKAAADAAVAASTSSDSNFRTIIGGNDHAGADADANDDAAPDVGDDRDANEGRGGGGEDDDPANGTSQRRTTVTRAAAPKTEPDDPVDVDDNAEAPGVGSKKEKTGTGAGDRRVRIKVPSGLDGKELKKFRKDHRRKLRKRYPGIRDELIVFVASSDWNKDEEEEDEGAHRSDDGAGETVGGDDSTAAGPTTGQSPPSPERKRRRTREFPRINEILAAQKAAERAEREKAERGKLYNMVPPEERARYVAVDCEMVGVGAGGKRSALARASLVDWDGNVILDTFVTVPERVTDFRTFVSGVRAKDIRRPTSKDGENGVDSGGGGAPGTMELHECRDIVGRALKDKVLVGHALKNDLQALLLDHPRKDIRDTARYKPYMRVSGRGGGKYRARKLRDLAKERLGMTIQVHGESHSSVDDAVAAMELYKLERVRWEKELALKHQRKK